MSDVAVVLSVLSISVPALVGYILYLRQLKDDRASLSSDDVERRLVELSDRVARLEMSRMVR